VNLNARQKARDVGYEPRRNEQAAFVKPMRHSVADNRMQARVTKQDLQAALGGRIFPLDGLDVLAKRHYFNCLLSPISDAPPLVKDATS
jgi:hypothetical protein